ncbi:hypothetical protein JR065_07390 [Xanthomonas sp. AmX2]|uniref:hypothetical protein n=1 Tax=Xanthomonas sp. TaxID=29446 RepID=UPI0019819BA2|nr:hypothetical protein [Xanthomonas sp.]MBN6150160.1 hypothetical protein [Xanthomonas sp.]
MTSLRAQCAAQFELIRKAVFNAKATAQASIDQAQANLDATPDEKPRSVAQLLRSDLHAEHETLAAAVRERDAIRGLSWWKRSALIWGAKRRVSEATRNLAAATQQQQAPDQVLRREAESRRRADQHAAHEACKESLQSARNLLALHRQADADLELKFAPLGDAINRGGWLAKDAASLLAVAAVDAKNCRWNDVAETMAKVSFQALPSRARLQEWETECNAFFKLINVKSYGFNAVARYPGLVGPSLNLARSRCRAQAWISAMEGRQSPADQWHALPGCVAPTTALVEPVQWVLYWAFLEECQLFAERQHQAKAHEDYLSGVLFGGLDRKLSGKAKSQLLELGYPRARVNLGIVQLAGLKPEATTGADVGLVVRLNVGDLHVHKVALLQAKVSEGGRANIGSRLTGPNKRTQLQKLNEAERDFFLFYHAGNGTTPTPLPTVTSVQHFVNAGQLSGTAMKDPTIRVATQDEGWEFACFVAFGLCTPANGIGKEVPVGGAPLDVLTVGGATSLPDYMIVVSLGDDDLGHENIMEPLKRRGYRAVERKRGVSLTLRPTPRTQDHDGHSLG